MYKRSGSEGLAPVGAELVKMLEAMSHRGKDSSGVTIAGQPLQQDLIVRIWADPDGDYHDRFARIEEVVDRMGGVVVSRHQVAEYLRLGVNYEGPPGELANGS